MEKSFILFIALFVIWNSTQAQTISELKAKYDIHHFKRQYGDPYNPALSGVASYFIPGLGQLICDEPERGLAFFGGYIGSICLYVYGASNSVTIYTNDGYNAYPRVNRQASTWMILGLAGMIGSYVWSIKDAVQVAKLKNLYLRDSQKTSKIELELNPFVGQLSLQNTNITPIGLSLKATF